MKNKTPIVIGLFFQIYFLISWIYSMMIFDDFNQQKQLYQKFWVIFSDPYHSLIFLEMITMITTYLIIRNLESASNLALKRILLVFELLFFCYIGFGLL